jgi:hypothetical protein
MRVPLNTALPPAGPEEVLLSSVLDRVPGKSKKKWVDEAWGYRGNEAKLNVSDVPKGYYVLFSKGFGFFTTGEKLASFATVLDKAVEELSKATLGIAGSLAAGAVTAWRKARGAADFAEQSMFHADSFIVPARSIVEARVERAGSLWKGRREYLFATVADGAGGEQTYAVTPTTPDMADALFQLRLAAERDATVNRLLDELAGRNTIAQEMIAECRTKYGEQAGEHAGEVATAIVERIKEQLKEMGMTLDDVGRRAWGELEHLRKVPGLAQFFPK